jgi:hypothetical protein
MFSCKTNNKDIHIPRNTDYENIRPFDNGRIGICHILPSFLARKLDVDEQVENNNEKTQLVQRSCLRYTIPYESTIKIDFLRNSHARLYGTTRNSRGLVIKDSNQIIIRPSRRTAEVIRLC